MQLAASTSLNLVMEHVKEKIQRKSFVRTTNLILRPAEIKFGFDSLVIQVCSKEASKRHGRVS